MSGIAKREPHRWLPGQSGNPAGRPVGSRQKLAEQYLRDLYEFWQEIGPAALRQMQAEDNSKFCQMVAGTIPRDLVLNLEDNASPFASLSPEDKRKAAEMIYRQLEIEQAKTIEGTVEPGKE